MRAERKYWLQAEGKICRSKQVTGMSAVSAAIFEHAPIVLFVDSFLGATSLSLELINDRLLGSTCWLWYDGWRASK